MNFFVVLPLMILLKQFSASSGSPFVPGTVTTPSSVLEKDKCYDRSDVTEGVFSDYCNQPPFSRTTCWFPSPLITSEEKNFEDVDKVLNRYVYNLINPSPSEKKCQLIAAFLLCSSFYPFCGIDKGEIAKMLPCYSHCNETRTLCEPVMKGRGFKWPETLNCHDTEIFPIEKPCIEFPEELRTYTITSPVETPTTPSEEPSTTSPVETPTAPPEEPSTTPVETPTTRPEESSTTPSDITPSSTVDVDTTLQPTHKEEEFECPKCALVRSSVSRKSFKTDKYSFAFRVQVLNTSYISDDDPAGPSYLTYKVKMITDYTLSCEEQIEMGKVIDVCTKDVLNCSHCSHMSTDKEYLIMGNKRQGKFWLYVTKDEIRGGCVISDWTTKDYAKKVNNWVNEFKPCSTPRNLSTN